jgi:histidyl-tRNA synthetase
MPFKRYQIANVWRADRPGRGRYREFTQCDIDIAGATSLVADASVVIAIVDALRALGLEGTTVHVNDRDVLHGLISAYGIPEALGGSALTALDKLAKIGADGVAEELRGRGVDASAVALLHADLTASDPSAAIIDRVRSDERGRAGLGRVVELLGLVPQDVGATVVHDPVLARGLGYYTGIVFEVTHPALEASIAGGGRYDGLIGMFGDDPVPAVGGSLGLERILLILAEQSGDADAHVDAGPDVLATVLDPVDAADILAVASRLRSAGIGVDVFVGEGRMKKQFRHADRRGARFVLVRGESERAAASVTLKELATGEQTTLPEADAVRFLIEALGRGPGHA